MNLTKLGRQKGLGQPAKEALLGGVTVLKKHHDRALKQIWAEKFRKILRQLFAV